MSRINCPDGVVGALLGTTTAYVADQNINYGSEDSIRVSHNANVSLTFNTSSSVLMKAGRSFLINNEGTSTVTLIAYNGGAPVTIVVMNPGKCVLTALVDNPQTVANWKCEQLGTSGDQSDIYNLGITYAANTLTIKDAQGNNLSANNLGSVRMSSTTAGLQVNLKASANGSFTIDQTLNWEWGITAGANWANDRPFFLYVVNKGNTNIDGTDGNSAFFLCDIWNLAVTPAAAKIGDVDAVAGTDEQGSIMLLGSYTEADYAALPCKLIGAIRMQYATATHKWTPSALNTNDGIGQQALDATFATIWTMPVGQMGAEAGKHFTTADGATALTFNPTNYVLYRIQKNSTFICTHFHTSQDANGADGTDVRWALPYYTSVTSYISGSGRASINNLTSMISCYASSTPYGYASYVNSAAQGPVLDNIFANTLDYVYLTFICAI